MSEGGSAILTCTSDAAPPVESFAWFKGTGHLAVQCTQPHTQVCTDLSVSALQIWTVAASQTAFDLSSTCPISDTPTGENTSVWLATHWEQIAPTRFYSTSRVSLLVFLFCLYFLFLLNTGVQNKN